MDGIIVGKRFRLVRKLGSGSFGDVYFGVEIPTHKPVAIKLENIKTRTPQLASEAKFYGLFDSRYVPRLYWFGTEKAHTILIMDLMSKSLEDLFNICHRKFSLKTILMCVDSMLSAIQYIHSRSIIHRDIKPDNFMFGIGEHKSQLYIIDFGLSKYYRNPNTNEHCPMHQNQSLTGTARYASINALQGLEPSRRDDLEALGYVWIYFLNDGKLPWMGLPKPTNLGQTAQMGNLGEEAMINARYKQILEIKQSTPIESLCERCPLFIDYMQKVRSLSYTEDPDYDSLRKPFRDLLEKEGFQDDGQYDWTGKIDMEAPEIAPHFFEIPEKEMKSYPQQKAQKNVINPQQSSGAQNKGMRGVGTKTQALTQQGKKKSLLNPGSGMTFKATGMMKPPK